MPEEKSIVAVCTDKVKEIPACVKQHPVIWSAGAACVWWLLGAVIRKFQARNNSGM